MLSNLEIAFRNQEDFISNASHELRTPITVMIAEIDYLLRRKPEYTEYVEFTHRQMSDLKHLNSLLNSLLELAQVNVSNEINTSIIRIDEVLFIAIQHVKERYFERKIVSSIQYPEDEGELLINGNSGLLQIAIQNLIENACKFSSDEVTISMSVLGSHIVLIISDKGIGIPEEDIENVLKPFTRASNVLYKGGFGIGLSLVKKILEIHHAEFRLDSKVENGTKIEIKFDRYQID
ncbi:MAG: HAMP domain-containing histidine kinase [Bacteroidales bacterium]|nr:HAMP domain-containing histidine kinase [Bacteroidales bacterium]